MQIRDLPSSHFQNIMKHLINTTLFEAEIVNMTIPVHPQHSLFTFYTLSTVTILFPHSTWIYSWFLSTSSTSLVKYQQAINPKSQWQVPPSLLNLTNSWQWRKTLQPVQTTTVLSMFTDDLDEFNLEYTSGCGFKNFFQMRSYSEFDCTKYQERRKVIQKSYLCCLWCQHLFINTVKIYLYFI